MNEVNTLELHDVSYGFRKDSETGYKRPTVEVKIPLPNYAGVQQLLVNPDSKEAKLLISLAQSVVTDYVRTLVDADADFKQETLDALFAEGKIDFAFIANIPPSDRNATSKEDLEAFAKAYIKIMVEAGVVSEASAKTAGGIFIERFKRVAGENDVLSALNKRIQQFTEIASPEVLAEHERTLLFLSKKLQELLSVKITADLL